MECLNIRDQSPIYERSENIAIHKKISYNDFTKLNEYKLTSNNFDPTKASPPNKWNNRLQKRINNYFIAYDMPDSQKDFILSNDIIHTTCTAQITNQNNLFKTSFKVSL
jgi:hypothetical protein